MREILRTLLWKTQRNEAAVTAALCTVSYLINMDRSYGIYMKKVARVLICADMWL